MHAAMLKHICTSVRTFDRYPMMFRAPSFCRGWRASGAAPSSLYKGNKAMTYSNSHANRIKIWWQKVMMVSSAWAPCSTCSERVTYGRNCCKHTRFDARSFTKSSAAISGLLNSSYTSAARQRPASITRMHHYTPNLALTYSYGSLSHSSSSLSVKQTSGKTKSDIMVCVARE